MVISQKLKEFDLDNSVKSKDPPLCVWNLPQVKDITLTM